MLCFQGYGGDYQREDNLTAYQAIVDEGITFIDTAEVMLLADFLYIVICIGLTSCIRITSHTLVKQQSSRLPC